MQVVLNADHHIDGKHEMAEHLRVVVRDAVAQFGVHVTRVVAHIADKIAAVKHHLMTSSARWKLG